MAAADITVNQKWATIECDDSVHRVTVAGVGGSLTNIGDARVYLGMGIDALARDDAQHDGEIWLDPNDSIPVPAQASPILHQCAASSSTKLWYIPKMG